MVLGVVLAPALAGGCGLPWDPKGTLDRVRGGVLRVGVIEAPPWAAVEGGEVRGVEVALVEQMAGEMGARVRWVPGGESALLGALEQFELDLVVGGLDDDSPWEPRVALTRPYYESEILVGGPKGAPAVEDLSGRRVSVRPGSLAAAKVRDEGGEPVEADDPFAAGVALVAAPRWEIQARGLEPIGGPLEARKHVLAAPPGENGWMLHVERFLDRNGERVHDLLRAEAAR